MASLFSVGTAIQLNEWLGQRLTDILLMEATQIRGGVWNLGGPRPARTCCCRWAWCRVCRNASQNKLEEIAPKAMRGRGF